MGRLKVDPAAFVSALVTDISCARIFARAGGLHGLAGPAAAWTTRKLRTDSWGEDRANQCKRSYNLWTVSRSGVQHALIQEAEWALPIIDSLPYGSKIVIPGTHERNLLHVRHAGLVDRLPFISTAENGDERLGPH